MDWTRYGSLLVHEVFFVVFFFFFISSSLLSFEVPIDLNNGQAIYYAQLHFLVASLPVPDLNKYFIVFKQVFKENPAICFP